MPYFWVAVTVAGYGVDRCSYDHRTRHQQTHHCSSMIEGFPQSWISMDCGDVSVGRRMSYWNGAVLAV
jgi:hypothetical protein